MNGRPAMSVIVLAYQAEGTIEAAVRSLMDQDSPGAFEVILVTSGGDRTEKIVRDTFPNVKVIASQQRLLPGAARNVGVAEASGEFLAFLEAYGRATPGWIARRLENHLRGHLVVAGSVAYGGPKSLIGRASHYILYCNRLPGRPPGTVALPDSAAHSLSFRRDVFEAAGPFDETVRIGEDTRFALKLRQLGIPIRFDPEVVMTIERPTTLGAMLADHFRRGRRAAFDGGVAWPEASTMGLLARSTFRWFHRLRWRMVRVRRFGYESIGGVILLLPFLAMGSLAAHVGWLREQFLMRRRLRTGG